MGVVKSTPLLERRAACQGKSKKEKVKSKKGKGKRGKKDKGKREKVKGIREHESGSEWAR